MQLGLESRGKGFSEILRELGFGLVQGCWM